MSHLKRVWKVCLVMLAAVFFSACEVLLINPLSDPSRDKRDESLLGRWVKEDAETRDRYIQFTAGAGQELNVSVFGEENEEKNPVFRALTTNIGDHHYLSLYSTDPDKVEGYLLARYEVKGDKMSVWILDSKKVQAAIEQKRLKGEVGQGVAPSVMITDTADKVRSLIESPQGAELFEQLGTFKRISDK